jgi:hypothetical protein
MASAEQGNTISMKLKIKQILIILILNGLKKPMHIKKNWIILKTKNTEPILPY